MKQLEKIRITRRDFLKGCASVSLLGAGHSLFHGCAIDPVTGHKQLMLMSREQEIEIDRQQSGFQFSSDYGVSQDNRLNQYISQVGKGMLSHVHRSDMPYNFHVVNATYINAYAFPGGSIAATRGILLELDNEAELASLLGHELGHVNARHTAEQQSKGQISSVLLTGLSAIAETQGSGMGRVTQQLGSLGQGLFLSKYSRNNEREADALGHLYMTRSGYSSQGFLGLMDMLASLHSAQSSSVEMLFATHPMSRERVEMARKRDAEMYLDTHSRSLYRERYMDHTADLRKIRPMIAKLQEGDKFLAKEQYEKAEQAFLSALKIRDTDYTAQVMMAKCMLLREKAKDAALHAGLAKQLYPGESQGYYLSGLANLNLQKHIKAYDDFTTCDKRLPGNPQVTFYQGFALDKAGRKNEAADKYISYIKQVNYASNKYSQYAYSRLKEWKLVDAN